MRFQSKGGKVASITREYANEKYGVDEAGLIETGPYTGQPWQCASFHLLAKMGLADAHRGSQYYFNVIPSDRDAYGIPLRYSLIVIDDCGSQVFMAMT